MLVVVVEVVRDSDFDSRGTLNFMLVPLERIISQPMEDTLFVTVCLQGLETCSCMRG